MQKFKTGILLGLVGFFALSLASTQAAHAGRYRIVSSDGGKCLDVAEASMEHGAGLKVRDCDSEAMNQVFEVNDMGDELLQIRAQHSGMCLDVTSGSPNDGASLQQWNCGSQLNQRFRKIRTADDSSWMALRAAHSGKCLDLSAGNFRHDSRVQQWDCSMNNGNQHWVFVPVFGHDSDH